MYGINDLIASKKKKSIKITDLTYGIKNTMAYKKRFIKIRFDNSARHSVEYIC